MSFSFAVPTSSVIALHPSNAFKVCVIKQTKKHNARFTLVGGRVELPRQTHLECIREEWDQEAGGKGATLKTLRLWHIKTDPYSDVRQANLHKLTHGTCPQALDETAVTGHYGAADHLYIGSVEGIAFPKDGEASECTYIDVRDIAITENEADSAFGAQHDLVLAVYRLELERGRKFAIDDFTDLKALRLKLLELLPANA